MSISETVEDARRRRRSPWRLTFGRRRVRGLCYVGLVVACVTGAYQGYALLHLPDAPGARFLIPDSSEPPAVILEVRGADRLAGVVARERWLREAAQTPWVQRWVQSEQSAELLAALGGDAADGVDWRRLASLLGSDAALAVYPSDRGATPNFMLVARTHPAARIHLAWMMRQPGWARSWGASRSRSGDVEVTEIRGVRPALHVAFMGRLGFCSTRSVSSTAGDDSSACLVDGKSASSVVPKSASRQ